MPRILIYLIVITYSTALFLGSALLVLWYYFRQNRKKSPPIAGSGESAVILPIRLQAYERTVLFLERITPANLVMRLHKPEMNAVQLQSALIKAIREEFDYNLSQQLYLSLHAWELVKNAKEEAIRLINTAAGKLEETAPSAELVRTIMELVVSANRLPVDRALEEIKKEIRKEF
ncbi:MAG TPA: hypothetical protein VMC08_10090 [Bacteroidales bacterium]|nr:hypothetical protein [Bacteroidales bacterium]